MLILLIAVIAITIVWEYDPAIDVTKEEKVLLWFTHEDTRKFIYLFTFKTKDDL